ncbi:MAG TPA: NYN domain-containing protein [Lacipirellula sp.]
MALIIDGYNLLHVTGVSGRRGDLQGAREALLRLLANTIEPKERSQTTIVFDAADAPPGLPRTVSYEEMTIHYAANYDNADEMIEELIAANNVPRALMVVSSDHRIQRAARRRKASFLDSDVWFADAMRKRARSRRPPPPAAKPQGALSGDEVGYWLAEFADAAPSEEDRPTAEAFKKKKRKRGRKDDMPIDDANPFPPGYGEDLLEEL